MRYEVALHSHILPKTCSKVKSNALSQDLFDGDPAYALTIKLNVASLVCEQTQL